MTKEQLIKTLGITENQYYGIDIIEGNLILNIRSIPEGFNPIVNGRLHLNKVKSIPKTFNPTVGESLFLNKLTSIPNTFNPTVGCDLFLNGLTSIPEGFSPIVGGDLFLDGLTLIPNTFNPIVGGDLHLDRLTSIPKGFNPILGGDLHLDGLKSIPKSFNPILGGSIFFNKNCDKPINNINKEKPIFWEKHIYFNGIFVEILEKKGTLYKVSRIAEKEHLFIITDDRDNWGFGKTPSEASLELDSNCFN